ncbi:MAG: adenine methyltransferase [Methylibium sp.]|uniref:hypothetical protein n=1 Tax=Methylibium sp. TaxID=2067992 RepID=UPI0017FE2747|nr:hypothetical protein [Methylibium sp.]MBA3598978.1 adenine methyltransferase [Methylibium sp.]
MSSRCRRICNPSRHRTLPPPHAAAIARAATRLNALRAQAHESLDAAVAAAYGWADYAPALPDDEILRRLLTLNRGRAASAPAVAR